MCLFVGNYRGHGSVRKQELYRSASLLGIRPDHTKLVDDDSLPDDPTIQWPSGVIIQHISEAIGERGIQTVSGSPKESRLNGPFD